MDPTDITITLPLSWQGFYVILTAAGIAAMTGLIWLTLGEHEHKRERAPLGLLTAFAWLLLPVWLLIFAGTLWQVWHLLTGAPSMLAGKTPLGTGALLAALLGAPFVVWGAVLRQRTVDFQKEGHITERITAAVEQLGAEKSVKKIVDGAPQETSEPNIEVRIGAILSLERIAQDSTRYDKGRDHVRVMEILCAYVRENAPASEASAFPFPQGCKQDSLEEKKRLPAEAISNERTPRADVQLALSVIGRRTPQQISIEQKYGSPGGGGYHIDLSRTNLRYADLQYMNFSNASFFRSQMQCVFCKGADLSGANFIYAELTAANAQKTLLSEARLELADLSHANLENSVMSNCTISHTHLVGTRLTGAEVHFVENENNRMVNRAFFVDSDMQGALVGGDLLGVILSLRTLPDENMPRGIYGAAFKDCRIGGTRRIFGHCHDESAIPADWLKVTFGDASVVLAEGIDRPAHWPDWALPDSGEHAFYAEWHRWRAEPRDYHPPPKPKG